MNLWNIFYREMSLINNYNFIFISFFSKIQFSVLIKCWPKLEFIYQFVEIQLFYSLKIFLLPFFTTQVTYFSEREIVFVVNILWFLIWLGRKLRENSFEGTFFTQYCIDKILSLVVHCTVAKLFSNVLVTKI